MPNYQVVSTRPQVVRTPVVSRAADDIIAAGQTALGIGMEMDERKRRQKEAELQRAHELLMQDREVQAAKERLTLGFQHDDNSREDTQQFTTAERVGTQDFQRGERKSAQTFSAGEAQKNRDFEGGQRSADRDLQRYGIDTSAATSRYAADRSFDVGMANVGVAREGLGIEREKLNYQRTQSPTIDFTDWLGRKYPFGLPREVTQDQLAQEYTQDVNAVNHTIGRPQVEVPTLGWHEPGGSSGYTPPTAAITTAAQNPGETVDLILRGSANDTQRAERFIIDRFGAGSPVHRELQRRMGAGDRPLPNRH